MSLAVCAGIENILQLVKYDLLAKAFRICETVNSGTGPYFRKKASEDVVEVVVFSANTFFIKVHARFLCFISENYA